MPAQELSASPAQFFDAGSMLQSVKKKLVRHRRVPKTKDTRILRRLRALTNPSPR